MTYRQQALGQALSAVGFGLLLLVLPALFLGWFQIEPSSGNAAMERLLGLMLLALGGTLWSAAELTEPRLQRRTALANAAVDAGAAVVFIWAGVANHLGALSIALGGLFVINAITWLLSVRQLKNVKS